MYQYDLFCCYEEHCLAACLPEAAIGHIEHKQCEGDRVLNRKHLSKELEIFEAAGEKTKNIKLLFNSLKTTPTPKFYVTIERAEHDSAVAVLIIFIS